MRVLLHILSLFICIASFSQTPLYEYRELSKSLNLPDNLSKERTLVVVQTPDKQGKFRRAGNWKSLSESAHRAFVTMGIDAILYMNHYDLVVSQKSRLAYTKLFTNRNIKNIIFLTQKINSYELVIVPFNQSESIIGNKQEAFYLEESQLYDLLLKTGKEIRRADQEVFNFLIPEKPSFISGLSIIEKTQLKNYPGILRRSTLAVERFSEVAIPADASEDLKNKLGERNKSIQSQNEELEIIMREYPYDYVLIDQMSDDDLKRKRYQFVLRNISGQAKTLREMLDYKVDPSETDFVSVIPIMPDQTRAKPTPKDALVHKFYIKQNISKNVHVGVWDADETWQAALKNMIGNLIQEHQVDRR
ncbi:MAG: hypothetical protein AAF391_05000 [Bacteroidota bacterium]